jgi:glyoxylase-like metal-dependent hydrolase (beta-lactamase superfamily II)
MDGNLKDRFSKSTANPENSAPVNAQRFQAVYHHADLTSCNSYVIEFKRFDMLIDPGGLTAQAQRLAEMLQADETRRKLPVYVALTHAHHDHIRGLADFLERLGRPYQVLCHTYGAEGLRTGDAQRTLSYLYADSVPSVEVDLPLFTETGYPTAGLAAPENRGNLVAQTFAPGENELITFYHIPGHSPDSVCIEVGDVLFCGDLLFAHQPVVAGITGWSHDDLVASIERVITLLEHSSITTIYGGHGNPLDRDSAIKLLNNADASLRSLPELACIDAARVEFLRECADVFMQELDFQLGAQGGRFIRLASTLCELGEGALAEELLEELNPDQLEDYLHRFHVFATTPDNLAMKTSLPMQGLRLIRGIAKVTRQAKLPNGLADIYLFRMEVLLNSYLNLMQGIDLRQFMQPVDLSGLVHDLVAALTPAQPDEDELHGFAEDAAAFARYLALRIDAQARPAQVLFTKDSANGVCCLSEPDHLRAVLSDMLELGMSGKPHTLFITLEQTPDGAACRLRTSHKQPLSDRKQRFYQLFLKQLGGTLTIHSSPSTHVVVSLPSAGLS